MKRKAPPKNAQITAEEIEKFLLDIDRGERTAKTYRISLNQFLTWLHYAGIEKPARLDILKYRQWLLEEHTAIKSKQTAPYWQYQKDKSGHKIKIYLKSNTVVSYMRALCLFFKWAEANGIYENITENVHAPKVAHNFHRKEALMPEQVAHILDTLRANIEEAEEREKEKAYRNYAMFTICVNMGLRTIEINRLNLNDYEIQGEKEILYIWGKGHGGADQKMIMAPGVAETLKEYLKRRTGPTNKSAPLFTVTGNRSKGERIAVTTISKILKDILRNAGYDSDKLTAHSLRHTAGTNAMNLSGNVYEVQKFMRHTNPATTEIYLHGETEERERETAEQLYKLYTTTPNKERK